MTTIDDYSSTPDFVTPDQAIPQLLEAAKQIKASGLRDFKAEVWNSSPADWLVRINFKLPRYKPWINWLLGNHIDETGFCVTGHTNGPDDRGLLQLLDGVEGKPAYAVWSTLYCEYLWAGRNFADGLERIKTIR